MCEVGRRGNQPFVQRELGVMCRLQRAVYEGPRLFIPIFLKESGKAVETGPGNIVAVRDAVLVSLLGKPVAQIGATQSVL